VIMGLVRLGNSASKGLILPGMCINGKTLVTHQKTSHYDSL
jgi:hypothetical protein